VNMFYHKLINTVIALPEYSAQQLISKSAIVHDEPLHLHNISP